MKIGPATIDTNSMTLEEVDTMIQELRHIRERKRNARSRMNQFSSMLAEIKEDGFSFCDKYTGEVLDASHFVVYDNKENCVLEGEWAP